MELNSDHIILSEGKVMGFKREKSKPNGRIMLHVTLGGKMIDHDFYLMDGKVPCNGILRITRMGAVAATRYQCLKFPLEHKIIKVRSNQCLTHHCNEKYFGGSELSEVTNRQMLEV